jgi:hypothetical protein
VSNPNNDTNTAASDAQNQPASTPASTGKCKVKVDKEAVTEAIAKLTEAIAEATTQNIKQGLFHLPDTMHDALWVATDLVEKSQKFPNYKLTFYHQGMGEGTHTCAVTFVETTKT